MTDCEKIIELLSAYYDGELSAAETELVRGHLDTCDSCAALLRLFGDVTGTLTDAEPPPELRERVMGAVLETAPVRVVNNANRVALRRIIPVAACLAVVLLTVSIVQSLGGSKSDSGSASYNMELMMQAASPAASAEDSYASGEMAKEFRAEIVESEGGVLFDAGNGAESKLFSGGNETEAAIDAEPAEAPQAAPSASPAETAPAETPPAMTSGAPGSADNSSARVPDYSDYYAVIKLIGEFPPELREKLSENTVVSYDLVTGLESVFVPRDIADELIAGGYDYALYNADAAEAVVIIVVSPGG